MPFHSRMDIRIVSVLWVAENTATTTITKNEEKYGSLFITKNGKRFKSMVFFIGKYFFSIFLVFIP